VFAGILVESLYQRLEIPEGENISRIQLDSKVSGVFGAEWQRDQGVT
jgi:hypothetical protein